MIRDIVIMLLACCAFVGCGDSRTDAWPVMDAAEALMEERPDSALALMRSIPAAVVAQGEEQARRALLLTMAELKAHRPADPDSVISIAHEYYKGNGHRRGQMLSALYGAKARYYAGRDTASVILLAKEAYDLSKALGNDTILARSAEMLELVLGDCGDHAEALHYCKEAADGYRRAKLIDNECFVRLDYAGFLIEKRRFDEAVAAIDSIAINECSPGYLPLVMRNANLLKMQAFAFSPRPDSVLSLYEELINEPAFAPDSMKLGLYVATAKYHVGDYKGSLKLLGGIDPSAMPRYNQMLYFNTKSKALSRLGSVEEARKAQLRYEELYVEEMADLRCSQLRKNQNQLYDDLSNELKVHDLKHKADVRYFIVILSFSIVLIRIILTMWKRHHRRLSRRYKSDLDELKIKEKEFDEVISDLKCRLNSQSDSLEKESGRRMDAISNANEYLRTQFKVINSFCSSYLEMASADKIVLNNLYASVSKGIEKIRKDDFYGMLYSHVNTLTGNFLTAVERLGIFNQKELKLITLLQTGASIHVIALILQMKDPSIFTMRSRMHAKLEKVSASIPADIYQNLAFVLSTDCKTAD